MTSGTVLTYEMLRQADEGKMENWTLNRGSLWVSASALLLVTWFPKELNTSPLSMEAHASGKTMWKLPSDSHPVIQQPLST